MQSEAGPVREKTTGNTGIENDMHLSPPPFFFPIFSCSQWYYRLCVRCVTQVMSKVSYFYLTVKFIYLLTSDGHQLRAATPVCNLVVQ